MERIYLDYAATTPLDPRVHEAMDSCRKQCMGNPNSIHEEGRSVRAVIDNSRRVVADVFSCEEKQVVFTPSATTANNLVIQGVIKRFKKLYAHITPEIIISPLEHASVYETARMLEREDEIILTILPIDSRGQVSLQELGERISERTALMSIQWVNNETGVTQPIQAIKKVVDAYKEQHQSAYPFLHTDAVQGIGHLSIDEISGIDYITTSAHKIYGPTGIGCLVIPQDSLLDPLVYGGGQENGWWSGTESVDRIVGYMNALSQITEKQKYYQNHFIELRTHAKEQLLSRIEDVSFYGDDSLVSPHIISFRIPRVLRPDIALDLEGIAVSSGAACSQQSVAPSRVLQAMGVSATYAQESIRVSFGIQTTKKDIDQLINKIIIIQGRNKE